MVGGGVEYFTHETCVLTDALQKQNLFNCYVGTTCTINYNLTSLLQIFLFAGRLSKNLH